MTTHLIPQGSLVIWHTPTSIAEISLYNAITQIATGKQWLNLDLHNQGKVLIEDSRTTREYFLNLGIRETDSNNLLVSNDFSFAQVDLFAETIQHHNIKAVLLSIPNDANYNDSVLAIKQKIVKALNCSVFVSAFDVYNKEGSRLRELHPIKTQADFIVYLHRSDKAEFADIQGILEIEEVQTAKISHYCVKLDYADWRWNLV